MALNQGTLARSTPLRRGSTLPLVGIAIAAALALLATGTVDGHLARVVATAVATAVAWRGFARAATSRERQVRGWIGLGVAVWLASELAWLAGLHDPDAPILAGITIGGFVVAAGGTFASATRGRMRSADELALYLDAASIVLALTGAALVVSAALSMDATGAAVLIQAGFFTAALGATLLLNLTVHVPIRSDDAAADASVVAPSDATSIDRA